ncbi:uncharacterized protein LOC124366028 isoform X1 [Homalodisca vitripennis]|uniref:uncharacterized protein LOC124366028 isoform X1 n=1 Tax=Homalodisca vitripennis TaxID=197043 RepID=UPI001EEC72C0|nr:uncharacterized protein LOC124366028 isoform X1 [Homalodisca vitripennis]
MARPLCVAVIALALFVGPSLSVPAPSPDPRVGCYRCESANSGGGGLLSTLGDIINLVLASVLQLVSSLLSGVGALLGPATDATTLLGALNGLNSLEAFLGSLQLVPKLLNIVNVPTAILG